MNVEAEVQLRVRGIYGVCFGDTNSVPVRVERLYHSH